jgi:hypothetical protein
MEPIKIKLYVESSGNIFPTFRDNLSVSFSGFKNPKERLQPQNGVDIGKCVGGINVSVV